MVVGVVVLAYEEKRFVAPKVKAIAIAIVSVGIVVNRFEQGVG